MQTSVICRRKTTFAVNALVNETIFYAVNHLLLGKIEFYSAERLPLCNAMVIFAYKLHLSA